MTLAIVESSSGAASASAMNPAITSGVAGRKSIPPTIVSTSWRRYLSRVATPKFPPPPRSAQNRSAWWSASTRRNSPSAVTISAASRSSIVIPCLRTRKPMPPLSVMPPMPTEPASPNPVASPCARGRRGVLAGGQAGLGPGGAALGVDLEALHGGQVEHDAVVDDAVAGGAVAAAADGKFGAGLARDGDDGGDVRCVGDADDGGRAAVDGAQEDGARLVVAGVVRREDFALDGLGGAGEREHVSRVTSRLLSSRTGVHRRGEG